MRWKTSKWLVLLVCLPPAVYLLCGAAPGRSQAKKGGSVKVVKAQQKAPAATWDVKAWGRTVEEAEENAVRNARAKILAHLQSLNPPVGLTKSLSRDDFVRKNLFTGQPQRCTDEEKLPPINEHEMECWSWPVSLSTTHLELLRSEDHKERIRKTVAERAVVAEARMSDIGKLIGWFMLALAALWIYLRVDHWTARAGRTWLRFGLATLVVGAGIGLWFVL